MTQFSVHGMNDELTHADWPALTHAEFDFLIQHFPQLGTINRILWYSPRPFSTTCLAETQAGQIAIKRHDAKLRTITDIQTEHAFIHHLDKQHIPVSVPLSTNTNQTVIGNEQWTYELFHKATGVDIYRDTMSWQPFLMPEHAYAAGKMLAQLHIASANFHAPVRQTAYLTVNNQLAHTDTPDTDIATWIDHHPLVKQFLSNRVWQADIAEVILPFYKRLHPHRHILTPLWGHNDWHASNLLWTKTSPAQVATIIDFGLSNLTSAVYDIATAIERNIIDWLHMGRTESLVDWAGLWALLDGYHHQQPLNQAMLAAIAALLPVVHVEYALSETDYFLSITHSVSNANIAYQDYLLGHAHWFLSNQGQQLLTAIQSHHFA